MAVSKNPEYEYRNGFLPVFSATIASQVSAHKVIFERVAYLVQTFDLFIWIQLFSKSSA